MNTTIIIAGLKTASFLVNFAAAFAYFAADVVEGMEMIFSIMKRELKVFKRFIRRAMDFVEVSANRIRHCAVAVTLLGTIIVVLVTPIVNDWWNNSIKFRRSILSECRENVWLIGMEG